MVRTGPCHWLPAAISLAAILLIIPRIAVAQTVNIDRVVAELEVGHEPRAGDGRVRRPVDDADETQRRRREDDVDVEVVAVLRDGEGARQRDGRRSGEHDEPPAPGGDAVVELRDAAGFVEGRTSEAAASAN